MDKQLDTYGRNMVAGSRQRCKEIIHDKMHVIGKLGIMNNGSKNIKLREVCDQHQCLKMFCRKIDFN